MTEPAEPVLYDGVEIPTQRQKFVGVDPIPDDGNLHVVSAMYVAAVREAGGNTSRLLTIAGTVVDDQGRVVGITGFNRN